MGREGAPDRTTVGILAILLGQFGIHKFMLGLTTPATFMLVVSLIGMFGCGLGLLCIFPGVLAFGNVVMSVIGVIEGIIYLTKSDEDFYQTYVVEKKAWF